MWGQIFNKKLASWNLQKGENYIILGKSQGKEQKCQPSLTVNLGVLETSKITLVLFGYENIISSLFGQRNIIMIIFGQSDSGTEWKSSGNLFTTSLTWEGGVQSNATLFQFCFSLSHWISWANLRGLFTAHSRAICQNLIYLTGIDAHIGRSLYLQMYRHKDITYLFLTFDRLERVTQHTST